MRGRNDWQTPLGSGVTALICGVICFWKLALGPGVPFVIVGFFAVAALGITVGIRRVRRRGQTGGGPTDFGSFK